jgi:hypothetical protein
MTTDERCPNVAWEIPGDSNLRRHAIVTQGVIPADIIMAVKIMAPAAYDVDYQYHFHGEDIGWSAACRAKGLKLGWDNRHINKHVLVPGMLATVDRRLGW